MSAIVGGPPWDDTPQHLWTEERIAFEVRMQELAQQHGGIMYVTSPPNHRPIK